MRRTTTIVYYALTFLLLWALPAQAQDQCFSVSDSAINESGATADALLGFTLGDLARTATLIGATGTNLVEAIEYVTHRDKLYFANGTEIWVAEGPNYHQPNRCGEIPGATDLDGMTYDLAKDIFYFSDRNGTGSPGGGAGGAGAPEDELIIAKIDNQCNIEIVGGPYNIATSVPTGLADVDDIAIQHKTGKLFGIANNSNSSNSFLIEIDPSDGSVPNSIKFDMPYSDFDDLEGMTFTPDGDLYVITGESAGQTSNGEGPNSSEVFLIDLVSGKGTLVGDINEVAMAGRSDMESLSCGQAELCNINHSISGQIYNEDSFALDGLANVEVKLRDANRNIVGFAETNADGFFEFKDLAGGTYTLDVNETTIPNGLVASSSSQGLPVETELSCAPTYVEIPYRDQVDALLGDFVWHDFCTPDGIADQTELGLGLEGAEVIIRKGDIQIGTAMTDSYGYYLVDGLVGGDYVVELDLSNREVEAFLDKQLAQQIISNPSCPRQKEDVQESKLLADSTTPLFISDTVPVDGRNLDFDFALVETVLAAELESFEVEVLDSGARFNWSTISETDFSGFVLELRLEDESRFSDLAHVESRGAYHGADYEYQSAWLQLGYHEARLKLLDLDGTFSYSQIIQVNNQTDLAKWAIYPNPSNAELTLEFNLAETGSSSFDLIDQLGRSVIRLELGDLRSSSGSKHKFDVSNLSPGLYIVRYTSDDSVQDKTVVILR